MTVIVLVCLIIAGIVFVRYSMSPHKSAYIGTWRNVNGSGTVMIAESGSNLSIRDERGRVFTGTLDWNGNVKTDMSIETSHFMGWFAGNFSHCDSTRQGNVINVTISVIEQNGHLGYFPSDVDVTSFRKQGSMSFGFMGVRGTMVECLLQEYEKIQR